MFMDEEYYKKPYKYLIINKESNYYNILKINHNNVCLIKMQIMFYRNL